MIVLFEEMKPRGLHIPDPSESRYRGLTAPQSVEYHVTDIPTLDLL
jgi:hypothetical protein